MKIFKIRKKSGKYRTIYAPGEAEKAHLRDLLPGIARAAQASDECGVQHGFQAGRSPVTNAMAHVGWRYTLSFDLADFFESVVPALLPQPLRIAECFPDGAARQGLPTSPALANIAAAEMDQRIVHMSREATRVQSRKMNLPGGCKPGFAYTRYADDLTFSFDSQVWIGRLMIEIPKIAEQCGFRVNSEKTGCQAAIAGRRMITGVAVDDAGIHCPRYIRRRLRAARHHRNTAEARGLAEWAALRTPKHFHPGRGPWVRMETNRQRESQSDTARQQPAALTAGAQATASRTLTPVGRRMNLLPE